MVSASMVAEFVRIRMIGSIQNSHEFVYKVTIKFWTIGPTMSSFPDDHSPNAAFGKTGIHAL
jgi:hypothetical protein